MPDLTEAQRKAYLHNSNQCPFCKSENIHIADRNYALREIYQNVSCSTCQQEWVEIFTLTNIVTD